MPAGDDLKFTLVNPEPVVNFTAGRWFALLWDDWAHRNGRLADAVLRLALRPGHGAFTVLNPVVLTLLGAACALWLGAFRGRRVNPTLLALGLLGLPLVLSVWPRLTGDTALWAAGAVNYLWPTVAVVTVGVGHVAVAGGWEPERRWALCLGLLGITGQLMHELASLAVGGMAVLTWLLARRQLGDGARVLVRLGWLGTLLQLAAPGLWGRVSPSGPPRTPSRAWTRRWWPAW